MKTLSAGERSVIKATMSALLSDPTNPKDFQQIRTKFSELLKTNFENRNIWLRFGLTISLAGDSPHSALQAYNECLRIDQDDPLPAMLAAKLSLEHLDDPQRGLQLIEEAIRRCGGKGNLLSRCYLLASIMHAHIYEREPESIKKFKLENMRASLRFLDLATESNPNDHLIYFHKALHQVKQRTYPVAIDNLRKALKLKPNHIPTMQLLILSLSAMKFYKEALLLCESTLHEHEDNLLLLYIKCNLEQSLVESKGYKTALNTAQYMLRCLRRVNSVNDNHNNTNKTHSSTTTISAATQSLQHQQQNNHQPHHQLQQQATSGSITNSTNANNATAVTNTTPKLSTGSNQAGDMKQLNNLFAEDTSGKTSCRDFITGELSVWLLVAEIFVKIGSIEDAEMCVDEGSSRANGAISHQVMYMRGLIAKAKNNLNEAKTFFQSCLALCPRHARALQQVAHVHHLLGNFTTAEKFLMDSLDLDGDCFKTWYYLSLVFIELNQHDKASECVKKSTALEETSPVVTFSAIPRLTLQ